MDIKKKWGLEICEVIPCIWLHIICRMQNVAYQCNGYKLQHRASLFTHSTQHKLINLLHGSSVSDIYGLPSPVAEPWMFISVVNCIHPCLLYLIGFLCGFQASCQVRVSFLCTHWDLFWIEVKENGRREILKNIVPTCYSLVKCIYFVIENLKIL